MITPAGRVDGSRQIGLRRHLTPDLVLDGFATRVDTVVQAEDLVMEAATTC